MSLLSISMDLFLAALMISALIMGVRLNSRLKALRQSHEGFARAIVELNDAAVRAEKGLAGLREAATETHDSLLARIDTARSLAAKLDGQIHSARAILESQDLVRVAATTPAAQPAHPPAASAPVASQPPEALRRLAQRFGLAPPDDNPAPRERQDHRASSPSRAPAPAPAATRPARPSRRPPPGEEDLFEPAHGMPFVEAKAAKPEPARAEPARAEPPRAEPTRQTAPPADMVRPDLPRPEWARKREPALAPEDFAARIRARKAAR